jgi:hypothetical protein
LVRPSFFLLYKFYSLSSQSPDRCATAQLAGVEESEDEDKDSKDDDMARMLLGDGDSGNSEDDESGSDQEDLLGDEHMDDDDDDSGDNEKDAVSGEEGSGDDSEGEDDVSEGEDDVSEGEDDDVIDKDGKETEGATWEDIYGRTRAPDGRILAGGATDNTAAAARYVPPAMRNKAALQGPDEKKRKELERLKKQVGVFSVSAVRSLDPYPDPGGQK